MAGNTAVINEQTLRAQWASYMPMQAIAQYWTVSHHQIIRLRVAWGMPPRNDRRRRHKPSRDDRILDPSPEELAASENSLSLAPLVAERSTTVQATWSPEVRSERLATKRMPLRLAPVQLDHDAARALEDMHDPVEW